MTRVRCEVNDRHGTAAITVDTVVSDRCRAIIDHWIDQTAEVVGIHPMAVVEAASATLTRQAADERAYRRVCEERGVLAL